MKIIGIVGSRRRDTVYDFAKVFKQFLKVYEIGDAICSGLCSRGGDRFAVIIQDLIKKPDPIWHTANWDYYGKVAGFIRNTSIARDSNILIACVAKDRTGGTEDTIKKFIKFHGKDNLYIIGD